MSINNLPTLNAILNFTSAILLLLGFIAIKKKNQQRHKKIMLMALVVSALFLVFYLIYHSQAGSVPYMKFDWTRPVYFAILLPHIICAALIAPLILLLVYRALKGQFDKHKKLAQWVWPVWMFVSVSGVLVYLMLYQF
jgi:putative membrane protein